MALTADQLKDNAKFLENVSVLYGGGLDYQAHRYAMLVNKHAQDFGGTGKLFSSPGRIEVIGNHTDHNNGKVLCASISVDNLGCVTPRSDNKIVVASIGYPVVEVSIDDLLPNAEEYGKSEALVRGVVAYYVEHGYKVGAFSATTTSDVFNGAGVSSSASFELLVCEILNVMFNGGKIDAVTKAHAAQYAENVYFGKPCGLLDQSAIALGGVSYIDFKSIENLEIASVGWTFSDLDIVLTNTGGDHADLTDQYAAIRAEMEQVAAQMGAEKLRGVDEAAFYAAIPELQHKVSGRAILRAIHYFNENARVEKALDAVRTCDINKFGEMIDESGTSSYELLQNCYPLGDTAQRIPLALALGKRMPGVLATRVHGGGFAGTVIAYVRRADTDNYVAHMRSVFGDKNVYVIGVRNCGTCQVEMDF